jgi:hypothetical protein
LCETADEYAVVLERVLSMSEAERTRLAEAARDMAGARFSEARFMTLLAQALEGDPALRALLHA